MDIGRTATTSLRIKIDPTGAKQGAKQVNRSLDSIKSGAGSATTSINLFSKALTFIGAGLVASTVRRYADEWTQATNKLSVYVESTEQLVRVQSKLFDIAQQTRTEFSATADLYNKLMIAQDALSASEQELIKFTKAVGQALKISGASANTARGSLLQLGQAMASGRVYAEEFNSIVEGMPRLAKAMAEGVDGAGGSIAKLKALIKEEAVGSRDLFEAILSQTSKLEAQFQRVAPTVSGAYQVMENAVIRLIGQVDSATGVSAALARSIIFVADNLTLVGKTALVAASGITAFFVSIKLSAIAVAIKQLLGFQAALGATVVSTGLFSKAVGAAAAAVKAFTIALAKNPFGLLLVGISTAVSYLLLFGDTIKPIEGSIASLADFAAVAFAGIGNSILASVNLITGAFTTMGNFLVKSTAVSFDAANANAGGFFGILRESMTSFLNHAKLVINTFIRLWMGVDRAVVAIFKRIPRIAIHYIKKMVSVISNGIIDGFNQIYELLNKALPEKFEFDVIPNVKIPIDEYGIKNAAGEISDIFMDAFDVDYVGKIIDSVSAASSAVGSGISTIAEEAKSALADFGAEWKKLAEARASLRQKVVTKPSSISPPALKLPQIEMSKPLQPEFEKQAEKQAKLDKELAKQLMEEHLSTQEKINSAVKQYNRLLKNNLISEETYRSALWKMYQQHELVFNNIDSLIAKVSESSKLWADTMTDALVDAAMTGKLSFKDMANQILRDLLRMAIRAMIIRPIFQAIGGVFGISNFGGFMAEGGPVQSGKSYVVGERGPELFTPQTSGFVSPPPLPGSQPPMEPRISINVHNYATDSRAEASVKDNEDGSLDIDIMVNQLTDRLNTDTSNGRGLAPVLEGRYGLNPAAGMAV